MSLGNVFVDGDTGLSMDVEEEDSIILPTVKSSRRGARNKSGVSSFALGRNDDAREKETMYQQNLEEKQAKKEQLFNAVDSLHSPKASRVHLPTLSSGSGHVSINKGSNSTVPGQGYPLHKLTKDQMTKTFDEWMKIAADNKITIKNTWQVALIDYFSDMSLLKESDGLSINFQKASCTLDGCVKVYTNRVDSVADETGKLLHGLIETKSLNTEELHSSSKASKVSDDEVDEDDPGSEKRTLKPKRKALDPSSTLAKTQDALDVSNFDLEFHVDPLFRKTLADFDEGGAKGLLLHNLTMDAYGTLSMFSRDEQEPNLASSLDSQANTLSIPIDQFSPFLQPIIQSSLPISVNPSMQNFDLFTMQDSASAKDSTYIGDSLTRNVQALLDQLDRLHLDPISSSSINKEENFGHQSSHGFDDNDDGDDFGDSSPDSDPNAALAQRIHESIVAQTALPATSQNVETSEIIDSESSLPFVLVPSSSSSSYFDESILKRAWAGPLHWKVSRRTQAPLKSITSTSTTRTREPATPFDFISAPEINIRNLFAPPAQLSSLQLSRQNSSLVKIKLKNLLPEDLGIGSKEMSSLMLNPEAMIEKTLISKPVAVSHTRVGSAATVAISADMGFDDDVSGPSSPVSLENHPAAAIQAENSLLGGIDQHGTPFDYLQKDLSQNDQTLPWITPKFALDPQDMEPFGGPRDIQARLQTNSTMDMHSLKETLYRNFKSARDSSFSSIATSVPASLPVCFVALLHLANENSWLLGQTPHFHDIQITPLQR
jgi:condensin complex subunit 2